MIDKIVVTEEIKSVCPEFVGLAFEAQITNTPFSEELWKEIEKVGEDYRKRLTTDSLKDITSIAATRRIYKLCGKDPSRYRPAAEALIRRVLKGQDLYRIDVAVDLINLASMVYGYSIGGFDADQIVGNVLSLGIGQKDEPYEGIGRGILNIEGLPVYRDEVGGIGTPTSDHERTKITLDTTHLLVLINGYDGNEENIVRCGEFIQGLAVKYLMATNSKILIYK
jgi:DNA/RNA-binding domain of Phe-tRNA-synthetase-like protein